MSEDFIYMSDCDGTGSMHPCSHGDPGFVKYVRSDAVFTREQVTAMIDAERTVIMDAVEALRPSCIGDEDAFYAGHCSGRRYITDYAIHFIKSRKGANQ